MAFAGLPERDFSRLILECALGGLGGAWALVPIAAIFLFQRLPWEWAAFLSRRHPFMKFAPLLLVSMLGAGGLRYTWCSRRFPPPTWPGTMHTAGCA